MKIERKEMLIGMLFAIVVAIFINYTSIERILDRSIAASEGLIYPLLFSSVWHILFSLLSYTYFVAIFNLFKEHENNPLMLLLSFSGGVVITYFLSEGYPIIRDMFAPEEFAGLDPMRRGMMPPNIRGGGGGGGFLTPTLFRNLLVLILNLLFVYIQRLLYTNQSIARRNEQLQLESIKSQHNALIQQINPHFFFNSLNSLRYIIMTNEKDDAIEYLDNLTAIFRRTLKASENRLHRLSEEMELTESYTYVIEHRFEGKFRVRIDIDERLQEAMIAPLSLLTLIENVVKHNKISEQEPIEVKIYTTEGRMIVIENNIVSKFEDVESSGIGLKNLHEQYMLLTSKGIEVISDQKSFKVILPLVCE